VVGAKPKGQKRRVRAVATAPGWLSPSSLGRGSTSMRLVEQVQNDHIRSNHEAQQVANRHIKRHEQQRVTVGFDSLPVPHLQEHDRAQVRADGLGLVRFRMAQWTIPLGSGDGAPMTVGSTRRTTAVRHG